LTDRCSSKFVLLSIEISGETPEQADLHGLYFVNVVADEVFVFGEEHRVKRPVFRLSL